MQGAEEDILLYHSPYYSFENKPEPRIEASERLTVIVLSLGSMVLAEGYRRVCPRLALYISGRI